MFDSGNSKGSGANLAGILGGIAALIAAIAALIGALHSEKKKSDFNIDGYWSGTTPSLGGKGGTIVLNLNSDAEGHVSGSYQWPCGNQLFKRLFKDQNVPPPDPEPIDSGISRWDGKKLYVVVDPGGSSIVSGTLQGEVIRGTFRYSPTGISDLELNRGRMTNCSSH